MTKKFFLISFLFLNGEAFCQLTETRTIKKFSQNSVSDGYILNEKGPKVRAYFDGNQGKELRIGWDENGRTFRAFLTFEAPEFETDINDSVEITRAYITVYEADTRLNPFDAYGEKRAVVVELVKYDESDAFDFDGEIKSDCGTIAEYGFNVLEDYSLSLTKALNEQYQKNRNIDLFQFRIQFTNDEPVSEPDVSNRDGAIWSIFAEEEESLNGYAPQLYLEYTITSFEVERD